MKNIKSLLGLTGTYQDDTILSYISEVKEYMFSAGISQEMADSKKAVGVIARGVSDLWNYGSGSAALSPYFKERVTQLSYVNPDKDSDPNVIKDILLRLDKLEAKREYVLPAASADKLGGVKAEPKTERDTISVKIGEDGQLYVPKSESSFNKNDLIPYLIKDTAVGNPTVINKSADFKIQSLKIYGESTQDGVPSPENPVEIKHRSVSDIKVTGKNQSEEQLVTLSKPITLRGTKKFSDTLSPDGVVRIFAEVKAVEYLENGVWVWGHPGKRYTRCIPPDCFLYYDYSRCMSNVGIYSSADDVKYVPQLLVDSFRISVNDDDTIETVREKMKDVVITYTLKEPTFEPLPQSDKDALKSLKTYFPKMVIDSGLKNEVEYIADTKMYIDEKAGILSSNIPTTIPDW